MIETVQNFCPEAYTSAQNCVNEFFVVTFEMHNVCSTSAYQVSLETEEMTTKPIMIMGIFVADVTFRTPQLPAWGQTVLGTSFKLGPGGKGSNQAVAAARLGGRVSFISKIGNDPFGRIAQDLYKTEAIDTQFLVQSDQHVTGAAAIIIDDVKGENAIVVTPGAANALTTAEIEAAREQISKSAVFLTQLELPVNLVEFGLMLAHELGIPTVLNPAPALDLSDSLLSLCDFLTPNETEAEILTGRSVASLEDAERAADTLLARGVKNVILTLGARGALLKNASTTQHIAAVDAGPVIDTTGAGDAFNGAFAVALARGLPLDEGVRYSCAAAGISVTRHGTAPSMPSLRELETLISSQAARVP